jgi:mRNA deadenylase 3'-5' endonuclease subunit Ccr4
MGVGIAIPFSIQVNSTSYIKSGDYIRSLCKHGGHTTHASTSESDPWKVAMDRYNTLIFLQVVIDGKSLCIGTYHMPNQYDQPDVMAIHSSIIKDLMFELAAGQDFIFAGDFNREPGTKAYRALTEKGYHDVHFPKSNNYGITYQPNVTQVLKSAYREKNGSEPTYTNFSDTPDGRNYCATIDYIFFNGEITVEKVLELPDRPIGKSYPDETHPSDHLMIAATFRLSQLDKKANQRSPFWAKMWN